MNKLEPPSYPAHTRKTREAAKTEDVVYTVEEALAAAGDKVALRAGRMSPKELKERQAERLEAVRANATADATGDDGDDAPAPAKKTAASKS